MYNASKEYLRAVEQPVRKHTKLEVYNDADGELVNLMRCIKYHAGELQREIDGYCNA